MIMRCNKYALAQSLPSMDLGGCELAELEGRNDEINCAMENTEQMREEHKFEFSQSAQRI